MHRRHRAGVPRVQRLQHVERLRSSHLADDDAVGPHAERVAHELPDGDLPPALDVRRAALEAQHVRLLESQLGGILDRDDPLGALDERRQHVEQRRLARPRTTADDDVASALDTFAQEGHRLGRDGCVVNQILGAERVAPEPPDRQQRPVEAQRRDHAVHARPVGQARIGQRRRLVDAPPERTQDALDQVHQLVVRPERDVRRDDATAALDVHDAPPVDHDLVHLRVVHQWLERAPARRCRTRPGPRARPARCRRAAAPPRSAGRRCDRAGRPGRSRRRRSAPPRPGAAAEHARRRRRCSTSEPGRSDRYRAQAPGVSGGARHDPDLAREVVGGRQQDRLTQRRTQRDAAFRRPAVVTERPGSAGFESDHGHPLECQEGARRSRRSVVISTSTLAPGRSTCDIVRAPATATSTSRASPAQRARAVLALRAGRSCDTPT